MRNVTIRAFVASILAAASLGRSALAQDAGPPDLSNMTFPGGRPTSAQTQAVQEQLLLQRATQIYLWAMPLINTLGIAGGIGENLR
jgi:hypothetical protein